MSFAHSMQETLAKDTKEAVRRSLEDLEAPKPTKQAWNFDDVEVGDQDDSGDEDEEVQQYVSRFVVLGGFTANWSTSDGSSDDEDDDDGDFLDGKVSTNTISHRRHDRYSYVHPSG